MVHNGTSSFYRLVDWILLDLALYLWSAIVSLAFLDTVYVSVFCYILCFPLNELSLVRLALDMVD